MTTTDHKPIPAGNAGFTILESAMPKRETFLSVVLGARGEDPEWVCWYYNHQTGGFFEGVYGQEHEARDAYRKRLNR